MDLKEKYKKKIVSDFMKKRHFHSPMQVPRLLKVVVNCGVGKIKDEKEREAISKYLAMMIGQKTSPRPARISIASFKSRQGMIIGYAATLRGKRMYDFLSRLINVAMPRSRDFRGIPETSVDSSGNLTIGIREHIAFPEIIGEDVKTIFGLEATLVSNAKSREDALEFYRDLGVPFKK